MAHLLKILTNSMPALFILSVSHRGVTEVQNENNRHGFSFYLNINSYLQNNPNYTYKIYNIQNV